MAKIIGAHLSISKGIYTIQKEMDRIGAKCCAIFVKNQKRFSSSPYKKEDVDKFHKEVCQPKLIVPHGSYLINLGNPDKIQQSYDCFIDDLNRCLSLGIGLYNIHPGSDIKKLGVKCLQHITDYLNKAIEEVPEVVILLENMAGQGNVVCSTFEEISMIISGIEDKKRIGVCLDTCHLFGAGYDIRTKEKFDKVMNEFDNIVGLKYLKAVHLNDSKMPLGSKKDRHECIGEGLIGLEAFRYIMNSPIFEDIPMVLETPDVDKYKKEIEFLYSLVE